MQFNTKKAVLPLAGLIAIALAGCDNDGSVSFPQQNESARQADLGYRSVSLLTVEGLSFKDLNKNGTLEPYEDWRLSDTERAKDLTSRMTPEEKAGVMMHGTITLDANNRVDFASAQTDIVDRGVNTFITRMAGDPAHISADNNKVQELAETTRLGIPVTISTDPRNHFVNDPNATSVAAGSFSQWPETLGFAAIGDEAVTREFGDIARQEYRATGIHMALSPQADLATEPRWGRINGTFGEDNQMSKKLTQAYIEGFQGGSNGVTADGVITVVKHFAGGGPQKFGLDPHNDYGKEQVYPGNNLEYHMVPFEGAFNAKVASVMPYYGQPIDLWYNNELIEEVGFGFSKQILTDILRGRYGFEGVILSDWGILSDCVDKCLTGLTAEEIAAGVSAWAAVPIGMPWGVESLLMEQRVVKAVEAGIDQFGGINDPTSVINAINNGDLTIARVDESVIRILKQKFELGLFENPYVDETKATQIVGSEAFQSKADDAQRRSHVVLKNEGVGIPLDVSGKKVFLHKANASVVAGYGATVVDNLAEADLAIIRVDTPYQTDAAFPFGSVHFGQLGFDTQENVVLDENKTGTYTGSEDYAVIVQAAENNVPAIVSVYLDRPAILTNVVDKTDVLLANFGSSDAALMDIITGKAKAEGKLPFELPSSWNAVLEQKTDVAYDSVNPLFPYGFSAQ